MERTSSPELPPELLMRPMSEELRAQLDHDMPPEEVRIHLGSLVHGTAEAGGVQAAQVLEPIAEGQRIYVELNHISAFVPRMFTPPSTLSKLRALVQRGAKTAAMDEKKYRQVLFDVNGCVKPGEVLALMGPSGSGKTSLLSIMGSRPQKMMQVKGEATFNGRVLTKKLKRQVGYVMQDDLLYEALTVHETLYYAAMLRLPRHMSAAEKEERVEAVIHALGLEACRDTITGGFFRKGISGGERKRTSVGHELLINPSLLFLDEPTSGLDSTTAMHLLGVLRQLAAGGRAIVTTIHQPSSRLYQQLDKLLLLSQGHVMYYGQASHAPMFFGGLGYQMPYGVNAADFLLDLASGDVEGQSRDGEQSRHFLIEGSEAFLRSHLLEGFSQDKVHEVKQVLSSLGQKGPGKLLDVSLAAHPTVFVHKVDLEDSADASETSSQAAGASPPPSSPFSAINESALAAPPAPGRSHSSKGVPTSLETEGQGGRGSSGVDAGAEGPRWGAPYVQQVSILLKRSLRTRRFESFSTQAIFQIAAISVLAGLFWLQKANKDTVVAARNTLGLLFFEVMFLSMRTMFSALFTFPSEQKMMLKERASGMYRLSTFYFARILSDIPMDFALPTLSILIVYFMGGLRLNGWAFLGNYGTNLLAMFVAQSLGLLLGALVMNPKSAQALASVIVLAMVLTGGFFVVELPAWIAWVKYLSYIYYALGMLLYIEFDGGNRVLYSCVEQGGSDQCTLTNPANPKNAPGCTPVTDLRQSLGLVQDPSSQGETIVNAVVLLGFLVVLRVAIYWTLRKKTHSH